LKLRTSNPEHVTRNQWERLRSSGLRRIVLMHRGGPKGHDGLTRKLR
jgi:hypothetical protein